MNTLSPASHRAARHVWGALFLLLVLVGTLLLCTQGLTPTSATVSILSVLERGLSVPLAAGAFLLAGWGLAHPLLRLINRNTAAAAPAGGALQWGVGLAIMLWLCHALGVLGLLSGPNAQYVALAVILIGLASALMAFMAHVREREPVPALSIAALPAALGITVLFLAALSPPGWLWQTEAGGYDTLSYHAQLALEWARPAPHGPGRLWPLEHNVYSFLPSYMEGAFLFIHVALSGGAIASPTPAANNTLGLLGNDGWGLAVCQMLHAGTVLIAACLTGSLVRRILLHVSASATVSSSRDATLAETSPEPSPEAARRARHARLAGDLAASIVLCTPWVVVTGSMMYNEGAVLALFAAALVASIPHPGVSPIARAALVGLLMGCACACKPTAMFLCVPTAALALIFTTPGRSLLPALLAGTIGGLITFGPPLIRNWLASGSPIFPAGTSIFGTAHWSAEQALRFAGAHASPGFVESLRLLVSTTPDATSLGAEPRGIWHSQFAALWPASVCAAALIMLRGTARHRWTLALATVGVIIAIIWWAGFSHAQSRFLMPLIVPLASAIGVAAGLCLRDRANSRGLLPKTAWTMGAAFFAIVSLLGGVMCVRTYLVAGARPGYSPNAVLVSGVGAFTGESARQQALETQDPAELASINAALGPVQFTNLTLQPGDSVMLLGLATPLYWQWPTAYHTTWDARSMCDAIEARPDDPAMWTAALQRDAKAQLGHNVTHVLIDFSELQRLQLSGWYDKRLTRGSLERWLQSETEPVRLFTDAQGNTYALLTRLLNLPPVPAE